MNKETYELIRETRKKISSLNKLINETNFDEAKKTTANIYYNLQQLEQTKIWNPEKLGLPKR